MNEIFLKIINMSISAGWLVLAVLVLRFVLKKVPKWVRVLLWGIVAVRLICPVSVESALSLIPSAQTVPMDIEMDVAPAIDSGIGAINSVVNPIIFASFAPNPATSANPLQIWIPVASILWIAGMAMMLLYTAISYWQLRNKVRTAVLYRDNIFQSENVSSPFVLGIIRPRIYLPFKMDDKDLELVLAHEQAHIRRKDHWWKPLGFLLLTVHWFNPLVWLAYILLCRDIELACDEKVIKELDSDEKADYTQALLGCSVNRRNIAACPLAFGEVGVKKRVKSVMNYKKPGFWVIVAAVVVCIAVAVCFLTDPKQDSFSLRIVVPAGSQEQIVYADEEISPTKNHIIISSGDGLGDTEVSLKTVQVKTETAYDEPAYLTPGMPVKIETEKGGWFKIGINMQNLTDEDIIVYLNVKNVEVRISEEVVPDYFTFEAEILEIYDGYFLVEPVPGSTELKCADRIEIPMQKMDPSKEPQVGDIIVIQYNGMMQETYPARLGEIYSIKVRQEEVWALIPTVMVDGQLYLTTGYESTLEGRCGVMDGEITSTVHGSEKPTKDNQSNFGTGYSYQYGTMEGTIEIYMNGAWWIYATEETRENLQFPSVDTAFELNFAGNTSVQHQVELTEDQPYWYVHVVNDGGEAINVDFVGTVYRVESGTSATICADKKWEPGTYIVGFATSGASGMVGSAVCSTSSVPAYGNGAVIVHDLRNGNLEIPAEKLKDYVFITNSEKIGIKVKCDGDYSGTVILKNYTEGDVEIMSCDVSNQEDECLFRDLTAALLYGVTHEGLEDCTLVITGVGFGWLP